jgi:hypothetical protein
MPDGFMENLEPAAPDGSEASPIEKPKRVRLKASLPTRRPILPPARAQSTIAFPYYDLDAAISVASTIMQGGGVALTRDQLAGLMQTSPGNGSFITKVSTARMFGLIANVQGKYELTQLGFLALDSDEKRQRRARSEAFLTVPLYRRTYDEFKGKQLPPRPHGLEQAFLRFGVAAKQRANARIAFERSARQAGFLAAGEDRLIEPIIGGMRSDQGAPEGDKNDGFPVKATIAATAAKLFHPFIQGLLDTLPEPGTNWRLEGRAKWLQAAAYNFDLIYKGGDGEIKISALIEKGKTTETD